MGLKGFLSLTDTVYPLYGVFCVNLFVSVGTVKSHTGNIYRKLGAKNHTEAI
jgi:hypothetical protein